jgi:GT2 family glycosyltransferase
MDLWVVDQSGRPDSAEVVASFPRDARVHYHPSSPRGLGAARNLACSLASSEWVVFTDDDCEVGRGWVEALAASFREDLRVGLVFGNVLPGQHDAASGFIPSYVRDRPFLACRIEDKPLVEGIGACMALRWTAWRQLGGFDEALGAGARFRSAEETDFAIRALLQGHAVMETPEASVTHHGFRTWRQGRRLIQDHMYGLGAMYSKHLRCGNWPVLGIMSAMGRRWAFGRPAVDFGHLPPRMLRLTAFIRGFGRGLVTAVDRRRMLFVQPARRIGELDETGRIWGKDGDD